MAVDACLQQCSLLDGVGRYRENTPSGIGRVPTLRNVSSHNVGIKILSLIFDGE